MKKTIYVMVLAFIAGGLREFLVLMTGSYQNIAITLINILGSFLLAFLIPLLPTLKASDELISGVSLGFIGSFTTFSTFVMQSILLFNNHKVLSILFFLGNLIGGFIADIIGRKLADNLLAKNGEEVVK
ncbi:putative fluoride ion transporter CrcB 2 [Philodulcilactobacillus myokoensis]|uniref:Fluoride-specific ion channel n=1 Tax=Philodulcilactobacillus myokoensis TaxID=2929573 RepID=A0A9W6AZB9_9LACO|nr:CrcB family protein [Philodulcilactobacillus myokoensis]GLB46294.1 putative fluoride ion transporter CrcB 2 [Philodulcilactobacillus myokoensis]